MKQPDILLFDETAAMLRISTRSWRRHWKSYVRLRGFPAPLPSHNNRPRWLRAAVEAWIANGGRAEAAPEADLRTDRAFASRLEAYANA